LPWSSDGYYKKAICNDTRTGTWKEGTYLPSQGFELGFELGIELGFELGFELGIGL
jgi:hypothetical protein